MYTIHIVQYIYYTTYIVQYIHSTRPAISRLLSERCQACIPCYGNVMGMARKRRLGADIISNKMYSVDSFTLQCTKIFYTENLCTENIFLISVKPNQI